MKPTVEKDVDQPVSKRSGFTLVEIMIVVAIIGLLAALTLPSFAKARTRSLGVRVALDMQTFGDAFIVYAAENGRYPADSHATLPPGAGMENYLDDGKWYEETAIGGNFNWEGPDAYPYAGVSVFDHTVSDEDLLEIDNLVDDGVLATGSYRKTSNGRFTYIVEE